VGRPYPIVGLGPVATFTRKLRAASTRSKPRCGAWRVQDRDPTRSRFVPAAFLMDTMEYSSWLTFRPPLGLRDRIFLTNTDRGTLLIVGAGKKLYAGVELELAAGSSVHVKVGFLGVGRVAADAHLTDHGLTVPVEDSVQGIRNIFVPIEQFDKQGAAVPSDCF